MSRVVLAIVAFVGAQVVNPATRIIESYGAGDYEGAIGAYAAAPDFSLLKKEFQRRADLNQDAGSPASGMASA